MQILSVLTSVLGQVEPKTLDPSNWAQDFKPFTVFHLVTVAVCVAIMAVASVVGRLWYHTPKENRFRIGWAMFCLLYQIGVSIYWFWPGNFTWARSLPLMLCDLAAFIAAYAMFRPDQRWALTMLYFWGIGLSSQAFVTPVLQDGYMHDSYWRFWIGHIVIVGSAIYAVAVLRYRPSTRDWIQASLITIAYAILVVIVNLVIDAMHVLPAGVRANYGYIGNTTPRNPTIIDNLGTWPLRIFLVAGIVMSVFAILWAVWRAVRTMVKTLIVVGVVAGAIVATVHFNTPAAGSSPQLKP